MRDKNHENTAKVLVLAAAIGLCLASQTAAETLAERGEYLVRGPAGCGSCHTPLGPTGPVMNMELGGRLVEDGEAFTAYAPNITPGGRVSEWSDEQLATSIREGLRPDGSIIGPPMPFPMYRGLGDEDLAAIVAFLRTVPAVDNQVPASTYRIPLPPAYGPPVISVAAPERGVTVAYGEYMAGPVSHCMECHTPMGARGPMVETDLGRGGFAFHGPWGVSIASNITPSEDGIAQYTDAQLKAMITQGVRPDGVPMNPPMPYGHFARMAEEDLEAIVLYLRSIPPLPDAF